MRYLYIISILLFIGCRTNPSISQYPTHEEYTIFSLLVDSLYADSTSRCCVLFDSTTVYESGIKMYDVNHQLIEHHLLDRFSQVTPLWKNSDYKYISDNFELSNKRKSLLNGDSIHCSIPIRQISSDSIHRIFRDQRYKGWDTFYSVFSKSNGLCRFSRVGFNRDGTQAAVYYENSRGLLDGIGCVVLLFKEKGVWQIKAKATCWVS